MHHAPETIVRQFREREAPESVTEEHRNFRRYNRDADVHEQHNGRKPGEQSKYHERAANHFASAHKRAHYFRSRNTDFGKAPCRKFRRIKKFLNAFGHENAADQNSHENRRRGCIRKKMAAHGNLNLRRKLGEIVDAESLLDSGHLIHHLLKSVFTKELVFLLLEILAQRIEFMRRNDLAKSRKENSVLGLRADCTCECIAASSR